MFSFISTAKAWFIHASNLPTFSPLPINSNFPAIPSSPSVSPANHRASLMLTALPRPQPHPSRRPPTSGLSASPWSKHSRSAYLSCSPEIKLTQSSPTRFPSRSSISRVTHSGAIHGAAGALLKSPRVSIPWPSPLPPVSPFLRYLFRSLRFRRCQRQSRRFQSPAHLRRERKHKHNCHVGKPRACQGKPWFSPTMWFLLWPQFLSSWPFLRYREFSATALTLRRPRQRPRRSPQNRQSRSSSRCVVNPRQSQNRPRLPQRETRRWPPLR